MYVISYIDFILKCAEHVWYIYDKKAVCPTPKQLLEIAEGIYASYLWFSGAHHVETRSPCFPIFRCVPAKNASG